MTQLLLEPLRQLADAAKLQSTHNRGVLRDRLIPFGERLGACVDLAELYLALEGKPGVSDGVNTQNFTNFCASVTVLLAERYDLILSVWWPAPWTAGFVNTKKINPEPDPALGPVTGLAADGRHGRLPTLVAAIRASVKSAKKPAEIWREIDREPGWRGVFTRAVIGKRTYGLQKAADQAPAAPPANQRTQPANARVWHGDHYPQRLEAARTR